MTLLSLKTDMKNIMHDHFDEKASPIFMKKVFAIIDESGDEKESLLAAADRISKMISLFIDKGAGNAVYEVLKSRIDKSGVITSGV
ncbi:MAG: hypothetical protein JSV13_03795 [Nitrospiraceae bacterium]|jgi:hypothetical protein|nr:MAG: hypothetical protein JSV13_03795 [Nitrospiraceae bacterium]